MPLCLRWSDAELTVRIEDNRDSITVYVDIADDKYWAMIGRKWDRTFYVQDVVGARWLKTGGTHHGVATLLINTTIQYLQTIDEYEELTGFLSPPGVDQAGGLERLRRLAGAFNAPLDPTGKFRLRIHDLRVKAGLVYEKFPALINLADFRPC